MMDNEIALKITGLKKQYMLGVIGKKTLQAALQSRWARLRGKPDPNARIGSERREGITFMALNGVDLTVPKGRALGIIGRNGAGKSTLLKLIAQVTAPTEGQIELFGRVASMLEVGTGFNGEMTGRENIYLNGSILGMQREEIDRKLEEIIEFSEVREFIDTPVKRYSSGMYVKLAFSVAAHLDSEIVIMDEVLAVGDVAFQKKCLSKMRDIASREGRTVLYVSHNMNTIRQLCDRCIVLNDGVIAFDGSPEEAISVYANINSNVTLYDIAAERNPRGCTQKALIRAAAAENGCYKADEDGRFRFTLEVESREALPSVRPQCVLLLATGEAVGTIIGGTVALQPGMNTLKLELDLKDFVADVYTLRVLLSETNGTGGRILHDAVARVMNVEVPVTANFMDVSWKMDRWGHVAQNGITVENITE